MIAELTFTLFFLMLFWKMTSTFAWASRTVIWVAFFLHLGIVVFTHTLVSQQNPTGIIIDSSVDAQFYYNTAQTLSDRPLLSITPADIARVSGGVWHMGYDYLCIFCMKTSNDPMLLMRLIKLYFYFICLAFITQFWIVAYGQRAALPGIIYLALGWWEMVYYNFRNFRDSLIVCFCIIIYVLWQKLIIQSSKPKIQTSPNKPTVLTFLALAVCLFILAQFRIYMFTFVILGLTIDLLFTQRDFHWVRTLAISVVLFFILSLLNLDQIVEYGIRLMREWIGLVSMTGLFIEAIKAIFAPIPWQYTMQFLIPSQIFYLLMVIMAFWGGFQIRPRPWGQLFLVLSLAFFIGLSVDASYARKRLPLIPILTTWMVYGLSLSEKPRIKSATDGPGELESDKEAV